MRLRQIGVIVAAVLVVGCSGAAAPATPATSVVRSSSSPGSTSPPASVPRVDPTIAPTASPTATAIPRPSATPAPSLTPRPTPEGTPEPTRTLAPGETPRPTPIEISEFLTAEVSVVNAAEEAVTVSIDLFDEEADQGGTVASLRLGPSELIQQSVPAALYRITFAREVGGEAQRCTARMADADALRFVILPDRIAVTATSVPATSWEDLDVATASACRVELE